MEKIGTIKNANRKLELDISKLISQGRTIFQTSPKNMKEGLKILSSLRNELYEDLNQIQHEALLVEAIQYLENQRNFPDNIDWLWNPRQTGNSSEPDIRGIVQNKIVVSAEATASESPGGFVDTRMESTLLKLNRMKGEHYYFVRTDTMRKRAETKVAKSHYNIVVICAAGNSAIAEC